MKPTMARAALTIAIVVARLASAPALGAQDFYPVIDPFGDLEFGVGLGIEDEYCAILPELELQAAVEASYTLGTASWFGLGESRTLVDSSATVTNRKPFSGLRVEASFDQALAGDLRHRLWVLHLGASVSGQHRWPENIAGLGIPDLFLVSTRQLLDYDTAGATDAYVEGVGGLTLGFEAYDRSVFPNRRITAQVSSELALGTETTRARDWTFGRLGVSAGGHIAAVPDFLQFHLAAQLNGVIPAPGVVLPIHAYPGRPSRLVSIPDRRNFVALGGEASVESRLLNILWSFPTGVSLAPTMFYEVYAHGTSLGDLAPERLHQGFGGSIKLRLEHFGLGLEAGVAVPVAPGSTTPGTPAFFFLFGDAY